jgi:3-hydroxyacyl-CoA dehydrogenase
MPVDYTTVARVAVLAVNAPPVNAFGADVRRDLAAALRRAVDDQDVDAIIIRGAGGTFMAGADISEFGTQKANAEPRLRDLFTLIEASPKPVVAAIHGTALGGGLEAALAAHARVAVRAAKLGLPEVSLGILPGAGGTQRLPRLVGPEAALEMMISGKPITAESAMKLGVLDAVVDDLEAGAIAFAQSIVASGRCPEPVLRRDSLVRGVDPSIFTTARSKAAARSRGRLAPGAIVDCVEAACIMTAESGIAYERDRFEELRAGEQHAALTHIFFAERAARKIPGMRDVSPLAVQHVAIVGSGTMGGGIAMAFANAGFDVLLSDIDGWALDRGLAVIDKNYAVAMSRGSIAEDAAASARGRITPSVGIEGLGGVDMVIEAVPENMSLKQKLFTSLDQVTPRHAILGTNTSSLDIDALASVTSRPDKVVGTHFFVPANIMKLMEIVRGRETSNETIVTAMEIGRNLSKVSVLAKNCDGFIGNRMLQFYTGAADFLAEQGVPPEEIDRVAEAFGMPMGPMAMRDMSGIDVSFLIQKARLPTLPPGERLSPIIKALHEAGRLGMKSGKGFYRYEGRQRFPDAEATAIIAAVSKAQGVGQRSFTDDEIRDRLFFPLVNEGANELADGTALRPGDIDVAWVNGYGFPAHKGGPMFWGRRVGFSKVRAMAEELGRSYGPRWRPSLMLDRLDESSTARSAI